MKPQRLPGALQAELTELFNKSTTLYPQITPLKQVQFPDAALAASASTPAAFPEKTTA